MTMRDFIELLQTKPLTQNCLAWSDDGELAVAAGEHIVILVPNRDHQVQLSNPSPWCRVKIKVNDFTEEEWPLMLPASHGKMDLGEEQSVTLVVACAWSPAGLGLHRRSVLAVLTANHLLSLWQSNSDPQEPDSWTRVLVVNSTLTISEVSHAPARILCMNWAPEASAPDQESAHRRAWGSFLLTIGVSDEASVRVLDVSSPYTKKGQTSWGFSELAFFNPLNQGETSPSVSWLDHHLNESAGVDYVGFGPTQTTSGNSLQCVSCRFKGLYTHSIIPLSKERSTERSPKPIDQISTPHKISDGSNVIISKSPATWVTGSHPSTLFLRIEDSTLQIGSHDMSSGELKQYHLGSVPMFGEGDRVEASERYDITDLRLCYSISSGGRPEYLVGSTRDAEVNVLPIEKLTVPDFYRSDIAGLDGFSAASRGQIESMRDQLALSKNVESSEIDVWNHGVSCYDGIIAMCVSTDLRSHIRYKTLSDEICTIIFSRPRMDNADVDFPWLKEPLVDTEGAYSRLFAQLQVGHMSKFTLENMDLQSLYCAAIFSAYTYGGGRSDRLRQAQSSLQYLEDYLRAPNSFAPECELLAHFDQTPSTEREVAQERLETFMRSRLPMLLQDDLLKGIVCQCPIPGCEQPINHGMPEEMACLEGHPLGERCGITFLPVVQPGRFKYCSRCGRQFLNEWAGRQGEKGHDQNAEASIQDNWVGHLLRKFDTCPYCDGKFYSNP